MAKNKKNADISQKTAVTALRFLYPLWAIVGIFGVMYVPEKLIVAGNAVVTARNIMANEFLLRTGIVGSLLTQLIFIAVVLFLYKLFERVNKDQSMLMVILALVAVPIAMLNTLNRVAALLLVHNPNWMMLFLNLNAEGVLLVAIFWGLWLLPLAYLIYNSGYFPKILGILMYIAGFGYVLEFVTHFIFPSFNVILTPWMPLLTIGEIVFMAWVLFKGAKLSKTK